MRSIIFLVSGVFSGVLYWHEFFVKDVNEEGDVFTVVERNRFPERGMILNRKIWREDLLMKPLCRKFLYHEQCLDFEKSMELAEAMKREHEEPKAKNCRQKIKKWWKRYNLCANNCEHTVRYMKTGRKESLQVAHFICFTIPSNLCSCCGRFVRVIFFVIRMFVSRPAIISALVTVDSKICNLLGEKSCGRHDLLAILVGIIFASIATFITFVISFITLVCKRHGWSMTIKCCDCKECCTANGKISEEISTANGKISEEISTANGKISEEVSTANGKISEEISTANGKISEEISTANGKISEETSTANRKISEETSTANGKISEEISTANGKISEETSTANGKISEEISTANGEISKEISTANGKISNDNFCDLLIIQICESLGSFLGSILGVGISLLLTPRITSLFLQLACEFSLTCICSYALSVKLRDWVALEVIKWRHDDTKSCLCCCASRTEETLEVGSWSGNEYKV